MPLTPAEAWCWVAHMHRVEDDALIYKYPRTFEDEREAAMCQKRADAAYRRATSLDPAGDLWRRAIAKWDQSTSTTDA